jgi:hypothetical protein
MGLTELIAALERARVTLRIGAGDRLRFNAPKGALTDELRAAILGHREDLVRHVLLREAIARVEAAWPTDLPPTLPKWPEADDLVDSAHLGSDLAHLRAALTTWEAVTAAWFHTWRYHGPPPIEPCRTCARRAWRPRPVRLQGGWLCGQCHPLDLALYPSSAYVSAPAATESVAA